MPARLVPQSLLAQAGSCLDGFARSWASDHFLSESFLFLLCYRVVCDPNDLKRAKRKLRYEVCPLAQEEFSEKSEPRSSRLLYPAAVPAIPFSNIFFSSSVSPTGGKHVLPEQTTAAALPAGK